MVESVLRAFCLFWLVKARENAPAEGAKLVRVWEVAEPTSGLLGVRVGVMGQSSGFGQPYNQRGLSRASNGATMGEPRCECPVERDLEVTVDLTYHILLYILHTFCLNFEGK